MFSKRTFPCRVKEQALLQESKDSLRCTRQGSLPVQPVHFTAQKTEAPTCLKRCFFELEDLDSTLPKSRDRRQVTQTSEFSVSTCKTTIIVSTSCA